MSDRDELAAWLCWENYDCDREWAECDHGFGYRDADKILAAPWLTEHDRQVRRAVAEEIAQAIEADSAPVENSGYAQQTCDAHIAREVGGAR